MVDKHLKPKENFGTGAIMPVAHSDSDMLFKSVLCQQHRPYEGQSLVSGTVYREIIVYLFCCFTCSRLCFDFCNNGSQSIREFFLYEFYELRKWIIQYRVTIFSIDNNFYSLFIGIVTNGNSTSG